MLYNKSIVSMLAISMLVTPSFVFAAGTSTEAGRKEETNFCTQIDTVATKIRGQLSNKDQKIGVKEKSRIVKLSEKRTSRDEVRLANRKEIDVKKDDVIKKLTEKADTDAKKVAVTNFQASIKTAVATRQAAVDASVKTYRTGVDALVNGKFASLDTRVVTLNKEIEAAITTAKSSCTSGTKGAIVRRVMQ